MYEGEIIKMSSKKYLKDKSLRALKVMVGTSLAVQWWKICTSTAGYMGLIPGQGTKILYAVQYGKRKRKKSHDIRNTIVIKVYMF